MGVTSLAGCGRPVPSTEGYRHVQLIGPSWSSQIVLYKLSVAYAAVISDAEQVGTTLDRVVGLSVLGVPGCDQASVTPARRAAELGLDGRSGRCCFAQRRLSQPAAYLAS